MGVAVGVAVGVVGLGFGFRLLLSGSLGLLAFIRRHSAVGRLYLLFHRVARHSSSTSGPAKYFNLAVGLIEARVTCLVEARPKMCSGPRTMQLLLAARVSY